MGHVVPAGYYWQQIITLMRESRSFCIELCVEKFCRACVHELAVAFRTLSVFAIFLGAARESKSNDEGIAVLITVITICRNCKVNAV